MTRRRLDALLAERGIFESRSRAAASVLAGEVHLGAGRERVDKPGQLVDDDVLVAVAEPPRYVSRGGVKLANALAASGLSVAGRRALDVGVSTGGFTDCLLQRGASEVIAVDVAYGELHWRLRQDPRVHVLERTNARHLTPADLPHRPDLATVDVSFISLTKVLPAVLGCLPDRFDCLALIKPQFEAGREQVGRGGVVRSADVRRRVLIDVGAAAAALGAGVLGFFSSGLPGPKGNRETFVWLSEPGRPGARREARELERLAQVAEPRVLVPPEGSE
jgi:23S rRNA (cytidine1920-2'-O)/16S rRNA (cytidine1409-2'-O)-methyltransferase